jgi:TatD DNase family protein
MQRCLDEGVELLMLPAIDRESYERMFELVREYPQMARPMMGLHPTSVNENPAWREDLELVESYLQNPPQGVERFWGVGEIGLDLYWSREYKEQQIEAFKAQIEMAIRYDLPIVVHTRDAWGEMCEIMEQYADKGVRGVFHAFSEDATTYRRLKACGDFLFGIGGVVTFKKSALADTVREMSPEDLLLETDCPYLTPVPHRGKRNESAYIPYICARVAELTNCSEEHIAEVTTRNAERIFGLK